MSVSSETNKVTYDGDGSTVAFPITFGYLTDSNGDATQIKVILTDTTTIPYTDTELTLSTHYTISGGTVTTVLTYSSDYKVTIARDPDFTQLVDHVIGGAIDPDTLDRALDQLTMIAQLLKEQVDRTLKAPAPETTITDLPDAASRASKYLYFDENGEPTAATQDETAVTVTAFAETVLDDATAAAAATTLGLGTTDDVTHNSVTADLTGNVTGNVTGDVTGKADEADGVVETGSSVTIKMKVLPIGDWDMDANANANVAHGLGANYKKIRAATAIIRDDDDDDYYTIGVGGATAQAAGSVGVFGATNVTLTRVGSGLFDSVDFDSTSYNRGWVTIWYEE